MFYIYYNYITIFIVSAVCVAAVALTLKRKPLGMNFPENSSIREVIRAGGAFIEKHYLIFLGILFMVFLFTRLYMLGLIPAGIMVDEVGVSYDAVCLLKWGTDKNGRAFPVYPTNFGDGNSAMYTYMIWFLLHFLPFSVRNIRIPAVLCSIPCFFASFGIVNRLFRKRTFALLGPIFVTFMPYFMQAQRWGLDCNLMLSWVTVALYFVILALDKDKPLYYALGGVFLGITLWTYVLSYLMLPLFVILLFIYLMFMRRFRFSNFLALLVPMGVIGLPLLMEQLVNMEVIPEFHFLCSDFMKLPDYRLGQLSFGNIGMNLGNIITYTFGGDSITFDCFREFGQVYWCCIPLIVLGFYSSILATIRSFRQKTVDNLVVVNLYGIAVYMVLLIREGYDTHNANGLYIELALIEIAGIRFVIDNVKEEKIRYALLTVIAIVLSITFMVYTHFYFVKQNEVYGFHNTFLSTEPGDIIVYTENIYNPDRNKNIYFTVLYEQTVFQDDVIALWTQMPPEEHATWEEGYMGHIYLHFPDEFDINEDAIYVIGEENRHVAAGLIELGFQADTTFPGYTICYR
ncbi:MAG: glycosyltransferase family 39 protein [Lachnospiraceae bacterium]|nr:glycosyltransferase family 39 protein [Lachnospiraceae bacterium]